MKTFFSYFNITKLKYDALHYITLLLTTNFKVKISLRAKSHHQKMKILCKGPKTSFRQAFIFVKDVFLLSENDIELKCEWNTHR